MVCVGPPLLASPAGSSSGLVLQNEVPVPARVVPVPMAALPESLLRKKVVLVTPPLAPLSTVVPPPPGEELPEKVQLVTVSGKRLPLEIAPPLLPEKVLLVT